MRTTVFRTVRGNIGVENNHFVKGRDGGQLHTFSFFLSYVLTFGFIPFSHGFFSPYAYDLSRGDIGGEGDDDRTEMENCLESG